ncbi:uncharacterized protein LOC115455859 [Manduca sexta]|uniref:Uncharacterized protein n=1 Tax=Manduca sexta TaxID=7130 RepID=A0A922CF92_MANSE|nr:uncharacterized protein LOC115455859 [Manduca sexta]KAG6443253.1 hypothetical protein O3G_MSEX002821 [Manduca sexta]
MVLLGTKNLTNAYGGVCRGQVNTGLNIRHLSTSTLRNLFFKLCKACQLNKMASIPPSAFHAGRIRETQHESRDMKLSTTCKSGGSGKYFNTNLMELSPLKYNSKLMNSIWGLYNRYSPHNVKKVNDAHGIKAELQQSACNSAKNEPVITLPSAKLDNVWAAINVSQSH